MKKRENEQKECEVAARLFNDEADDGMKSGMSPHQKEVHFLIAPQLGDQKL